MFEQAIERMKKSMEAVAYDLSMLPKSDRYKWIPYLLECVEQEAGEACLKEFEEALKDRFEHGRW